MGICYAGDGTNRLFVVVQTGMIRVFENSESASVSQVFLDISRRVLYGGEQGLLGLAFHPNYKANGYFYVDYLADNPWRTIIARYSTMTVDPNRADENSELILLVVDQPFANHKGGQLAFGPDGYLYIALGDGGSEGDPLGNGQNLSSMLGKILRIGSALPGLYGAYVYGDYGSGKIWALEYDGTHAPVNTLLIDSTLTITSFGIDEAKELYISAFDGKIYRLEA